MNSGIPSTAPTRWARFECKYLVSERTAEAMRRWVQPWVQPDPYAAKSPSHSYRISSLYLDSDDRRLYRETREGRANRYKLRVRGYSSDPEAPVFLEIKRRCDRVVKKARLRVPRAAARRIVQGRSVPVDILDTDALSEVERSVLDEFVMLRERSSLHPVVHVGYQRQAYVGTFANDDRLTFDRSIICSPAGESDALFPTTQSHDVEPLMVVVELKFNSTYPSWMRDCVRTFELDRCSYSKYANSIDRSPFLSQSYSTFLSSRAGGLSPRAAGA